MIEWITAASLMIVAGGVIFVAIQAKVAVAQLQQAKKEFIADHERTRRMYAIEVVKMWTNSLDKAQPSARGVVEQFSKEQCLLLKRREPIKVDASLKKRLEYALQDVITDPKELEPKNGDISLEHKHVAQLYFLIVSHLNSLEVALMPWMYGVADQEIIESELKYLIRPDEGQYVLLTMREVLGKNSFPAILKFANYLRNKYDNSIPNHRDKIA